MKLKYIIPSLLALVAGVFTGCSDDDDPILFDGLNVSQSYVSIPEAGGTTSIKLNAAADWEFEDLYMTVTKNADGTKDTTYNVAPEWLTVTPAKGAAGRDIEITFSAPATEYGLSCELIIKTKDNLEQHITVMQGLPTVQDATCKEVIEGPDSKTYRVKGTVTAIANTQYGNWYLNDGTGEVYIYGTLDKKGAEKNFASLGIEVGDVVTVEGPKTTYGSTVELVNVTVVKIEKSLIKIDSLSIADGNLPKDGGDITAFITCKGDGVYAEVPESAKSWLSIAQVKGGSAPSVTFHAQANNGGAREATLTLKTTKGGKDYTAEMTVKQEGSIVDCSVSDFLAAEVGSTQYRITGIITKVAKAAYGNIYVKDYSGEVYVYGVGSKGDFEAAGLKEGDIVTLVGTRDAYNGTAQMKGAQLESSKSVTEVTIAEFLTKEDNKDVYYMVKGTVKDIVNATYGNLNLTDGTNDLYVYGTYPGYGATGDARKGTIDAQGIEAGDELTVIGPKGTYNGTPQVNGGIFFSLKKAE